jgi:hypothetical protein
MIKFKRKRIPALSKVARVHSINGIKIISRKKEPLKIPVTAPIRVRTKQLSPNGDAERKSSNNPEKNPETCPVMVPFT